MKNKHIQAYMKICDVLGQLSECRRPNRKFGAVLVDPVANVILATGYNGYLRGGTACCGGDTLCVREALHITSGEKLEIGCVHAEENALLNASRQGAYTVGCWLFVNGEPCEICARMMVQTGIRKVWIKKVGYPGKGAEILKENEVEVEYIEVGKNEPK